MKLKKKILTLSVLTFMAMTAAAQHNLFDTLAKPTLISNQFAFTEGC
jgi:hypothetical protein